MTHISLNRQSHSAAALKVNLMKTRITQSKKARSVLLTVYEGYSTYSITLPMPYAIRFFIEGLLSALEALDRNEEVQGKLAEKEGETADLQRLLMKAVENFDGFLDEKGR